MARRSHLAALAFSGACIVGSMGCGGPGEAAPTDVDRDAHTLLRILSNEYGEFLNSRGRVPKDAAEFRKYLEPRSASAQSAVNVQSMDELLRSPRDKQPLVIVTGRRIEPADAPGVPWAFREREGLDGQVLAVGVRYGPVRLSLEEAKSQIPEN